MTPNAFARLALFLVALTALAHPLGRTMARVLEGRPTWIGRALGPLERWCYRLAGVHAEREMDWRRYATAMLLFNAAGLVLLYLIQRLQPILPLNPRHLPAVAPHLAFNTAVSFATNTNWQSYAGELTMSTFTRMLGLTVQNLVSAATGIAVGPQLRHKLERDPSRPELLLTGAGVVYRMRDASWPAIEPVTLGPAGRIIYVTGVVRRAGRAVRRRPGPESFLRSGGARATTPAENPDDGRDRGPCRRARACPDRPRRHGA